MFVTLALIGGGLMVVAMIMTLALIAYTRNELVRAIVSDLIFYAMIGIYVIWTMFHHTHIAYEIVLLAAIAGGILPTLSMARIISKGRR